jgi:hypothetical protein
MAVYQGTRLRNSAAPAVGSMARPVRVPAPASADTTPRVRPMGLLMAAIVATTMVGMVYLTQTLGTNATSYEIYKLETEGGKLATEIKRHEIMALDLTQPEVVLPKAQKQKLKRLRGEPIVLSAP